MNGAILSAHADAAASRYLLLLNGLRGIQAQALTQGNLIAPAVLERVARQGYQIAERYLTSERDNIAQTTQQIATDAQQRAQSDLGVSSDTALTARTSELLSLAGEILRNEIVIQAERDVGKLKGELRQAALEVELAAMSQGISRESALIQQRLNAGKTAFTFQDRAGRRWASQKYIRTIWRQHLLTSWNETYLTTLADHGVTTAEIQHPDPASRFAGMKISILPSTDLPSYGELRQEAFHPNSEARVSIAR